MSLSEVSKLYSEWRPPTPSENVPDRVRTRRHGFLWRKKTTTRMRPVMLKTDESGSRPAYVHRYVKDYSEVSPREAKRVTRFSRHVGGETGVAKYAEAMPKTEQRQLVRRKKKQKRLSELSAGLGLAAFASQVPKIAGLASRNKRIGSLRPVKRIARMQATGQKASDAIVPASLGTGALGSMNFARTTGQEVKAQERELNKSLRRDDRFLRTYRNNISPSAEDAYRELGRRKRRRYSDAAMYSVPAAYSGVITGTAARNVLSRETHRAWKHAARPEKVEYVRRMVGSTAVGAGLAALAGRAAYRRIQEGRSLQGRRDKIKAKGVERALTGERGRGRPALVGKARLMAVPRRTRLNPVRPRAGGVRRSPYGGAISYRGSIPGTGRYAAGWRS